MQITEFLMKKKMKNEINIRKYEQNASIIVC